MIHKFACSGSVWMLYVKKSTMYNIAKTPNLYSTTNALLRTFLEAVEFLINESDNYVSHWSVKKT